MARALIVALSVIPAVGECRRLSGTIVADHGTLQEALYAPIRTSGRLPAMVLIGSLDEEVAQKILDQEGI